MWVKVSPPAVKPRTAAPPRRTTVRPATPPPRAAPAPSRPYSPPPSAPPRAPVGEHGGGQGRVNQAQINAQIERDARAYAQRQAQERLRRMATAPMSERTPTTPQRPGFVPGRLAVRGTGTVGRNYVRGAELRGGPGRYQTQFFIDNYSTAKKLNQPGRVEALQRTLRGTGYDVAVDGVWGPQTAKAWLDYARELGQAHAADYLSRTHGAPVGEHASTLGRVAPGNIDLANRPVVHNPDGSISTVRSITIQTPDGYVLIPTVVGGRVVSNAEAIAHYRRTGEHLGIYSSEAAADHNAQQIHLDQAARYAPQPSLAPTARPGYAGESAADLVARVGPIYVDMSNLPPFAAAEARVQARGSSTPAEQAQYKTLIDNTITWLQQSQPGVRHTRADWEKLAREQLSQVQTGDPSQLDPATLAEAHRQAVANQGGPVAYYTKKALGVPGRMAAETVPTHVVEAVLDGRMPTAKEVGGDVALAALLLTPGQLGTVLRMGTRGVEEAATAVRAARAGWHLGATGEQLSLRLNPTTLRHISSAAVRGVRSAAVDAAEAAGAARMVKMDARVERGLASDNKARQAAAQRFLKKGIDPHREELDQIPARQNWIEAASKPEKVSAEDVDSVLQVYDWHAIQIANAKGIPLSEAWPQLVRETHYMDISPIAAQAREIAQQTYERSVAREMAAQTTPTLFQEGTLYGPGGGRYPFYSETARAISVMPERMGTQEFMAKLRKTPGVREDEIDALQFPLFAETAGKSITRQEAQAWYDSHYLTVNENIRGTVPNDLRGVDPNNPFAESFDQPGSSGTRFGDYTLPGGTEPGAGYHELTIQLPSSERGALGDFTAGHFPEKNVIAHVRFTTRQVDGKRTLMIEEIQSDWHQAGQTRGYKMPVERHPDYSARLERYQKARDDLVSVRDRLERDHKLTAEFGYPDINQMNALKDRAGQVLTNGWHDWEFTVGRDAQSGRLVIERAPPGTGFGYNAYPEGWTHVPGFAGSTEEEAQRTADLLNRLARMDRGELADLHAGLVEHRLAQRQHDEARSLFEALQADASRGVR